MTNELTLTGQWYIPQTHETLPGTLLIIRDKKRIILRLTALATEDDPMASVHAFGHQELIQGRIDTGGKVLLYDCTFGGPHNYIGQKTEVMVTIGAAFWNLDIDSVEDLCFQKVSIDFGEIIEWSGLCSYEWEMTEGGNGDRLVWKCEKDVVFQIDEEVSLRISAQPGSHKMWSYSKELVVSQAVYMFLEYQTERHWKSIEKDIRALRSLLTLGMSRRIFVDEMQYYHKSNQDPGIPEYIHGASVYLGDEQEGHTSSDKGKYSYLFTLDDLTEEGCRCLRNWYDKYERMKPVVELYEAAWNVPGISAEMLFLNLAQALETYHARFVCDDLKQYVRLVDAFLRETYELEADVEYSEHEKARRRILINQNEDKSRSIVLKSRLGYLFLARFEYVFSFLDYSREDFIERMVHTRNYYTHYSPDKERLIFPIRKLPYVNGILMAVLQYYMMKEIGIPDDRLGKKVGMQIEGVMRSYRIMEQ